MTGVWVIWLRNLGEGTKFLSSPKHPDWLWGLSSLTFNGDQGYSDHLSPSSAQVKKYDSRPVKHVTHRALWCGPCKCWYFTGFTVFIFISNAPKISCKTKFSDYLTSLHLSTFKNLQIKNEMGMWHYMSWHNLSNWTSYLTHNLTGMV